MKKIKIALYIAVVAFLISVIGILVGTLGNNFSVASAIMSIGWVVGWVAYVFGGLLTAIKLAGKIAKWGWIITPFPIDIITGIFTFIIAVYVLLFMPVIPIAMAYKESM